MTGSKRLLARKGATAVARHSAHGVMSKARRRPMRTATLLGAGTCLGAASGWMAARRMAAHDDEPRPHTPAVLAGTPSPQLSLMADADRAAEAAGFSRTALP